MSDEYLDGIMKKLSTPDAGSETPRTDYVLEEPSYDKHYAVIDLARQLERELAAALAEKKVLEDKLDRFTRLSECGRSYGDELDTMERCAQLEEEKKALEAQISVYAQAVDIREWHKLSEEKKALEERLAACERRLRSEDRVDWPGEYDS